jgi:hypothetical protein
LSISEEIERRLTQFASWENRYGEAEKMAQKLLDTVQQSLEMDLEKALMNTGFRRVLTTYGPAYVAPRTPHDVIDGTADADAILDKVMPSLRRAIGDALLGKRLHTTRAK